MDLWVLKMVNGVILVKLHTILESVLNIKKQTNKQTKKKKIQECLITNLYSDNIIVLLGDCNYSEWTCKNEYLCI